MATRQARYKLITLDDYVCTLMVTIDGRFVARCVSPHSQATITGRLGDGEARVEYSGEANRATLERLKALVREAASRVRV